MASSPFWHLKVEGKENVAPGKTYVIVSNHQSLLDILIVLSGLPRHTHFKFLAKKELFPIPFLGWHMSLAGYIPLDRKSHESGKKAMLTARHWLRKGVSVIFFPEGTRSLDGEIHSFKVGAFKLAQEEDLEILPLVIDGTGDAVPKHSWMLEKTTRLFLSIGKPISLKNQASTSSDQTCEAIRQEMIERLARVRDQR